MPVRCCIVCGRRPSPITRLYHFPRDEERRAAWLEAMKVTHLVKDVHRYNHICCLHFPDSAYVDGTKEKLNPDAIPSLFPRSVPDDDPEGFSTIAMSKVISDHQLVDDFELTQNLSLLDDFKMPIFHPLECNSCNEKDNLHQTTSKNENQTELASVELEENIQDQDLDEIEVRLSTDPTEVNTDKTTLTEKPYFKSVKCYLQGSATFTEVCRICFRALIAEEEVIKLYGEEISTEDETCLKHMLKLVLPDMDLEMYPNTVICKKCVQLLESSYQLKDMWLSTETKLQKILEKKKATINRDADLIILAKEGKNETLPETEHSYAETPKDLGQQSNKEQKVTVSLLENLLTKSDNSFPKKVQIYHGELNMNGSAQIKPVNYPKRKKKEKVKKPKKPKKPKEREIMCEICGNMFMTFGALKQHSKTHVETKCSFCGKEFKQREMLRRHIYHIHTAPSRSYQCHLCGKQYPYPSSLRSHLLRHSPKGKVHLCNICDRKFLFPSLLRKHQRRHMSVAPLTCDYCGKSVKYEHSLQRHIKLFHMNEGEFVCEFCDKPYWKRCDLQRHRIRVHGCSEDQQTVVLVNENNYCADVPVYEIEYEV